jgi:hypothetical protein
MGIGGAVVDSRILSCHTQQNGPDRRTCRTRIQSFADHPAQHESMSLLRRTPNRRHSDRITILFGGCCCCCCSDIDIGEILFSLFHVAIRSTETLIIILAVWRDGNSPGTPWVLDLSTGLKMRHHGCHPSPSGGGGLHQAWPVRGVFVLGELLLQDKIARVRSVFDLPAALAPVAFRPPPPLSSPSSSTGRCAYVSSAAKRETISSAKGPVSEVESAALAAAPPATASSLRFSSAHFRFSVVNASSSSRAFSFSRSGGRRSRKTMWRPPSLMHLLL